MKKWKDIPGYEGFYKISEDGLVKSLGRKVSCHGDKWRKTNDKILSPTLDAYGYCRALLCKNGEVKHWKVHRLVALTFIGPSDLPINHKDMNKRNNHYSNLEYMTLGENVKHARKNRKWDVKSISGENHHASKLTNEDVLKIRSLKNKYNQKELAKMFNISRRNIGMILKRLTWKHV